MSKARDWSREGADAIIDHLHPVLKAASRTGDPSAVLYAYSGALGAWWGALVADAGPEHAQEIAEILVRKMLGVDIKGLMN